MTMTATNHDDQLGEIYPAMPNELNCTFGMRFSCLHCYGHRSLWPSWYRPVLSSLSKCRLTDLCQQPVHVSRLDTIYLIIYNSKISVQQQLRHLVYYQHDIVEMHTLHFNGHFIQVYLCSPVSRLMYPCCAS